MKQQYRMVSPSRVAEPWVPVAGFDDEHRGEICEAEAREEGEVRPRVCSLVMSVFISAQLPLGLVEVENIPRCS